MKIEGSVALVTGANRGLGAAFVRALLDAGAAKVYAAARDPSSVTSVGAIPVRLDVTRSDQTQALWAQGTSVLSMHVAFVDTDMARGVPGTKMSPDEVARLALAALETGQSELLADELTRSVHAGLTAVPPMYLGMPG